MPQEIILTKFIEYLNINEAFLIENLQKEFPSNYQEKVKDLQTHLNKLRDFLLKGHCFGLSVVHAAMDEMEKLQWWEEALQTIVTWDGTRESLEELIELSDAEEAAFWQATEKEKSAEEAQTQTDKTKIKLKILFARILDYVVSHQTAYERLTGLNQTTLLSPHHNYFEALYNKEIKQITIRKFIAGTFHADEIINLLNEETFKNGISLFHSRDHTIRVYFKEGEWCIYDPNYNHKSIDDIHKSFVNKIEVVEEILMILDTALAIEIASSNDKKIISLPDLSSLKIEPQEIANKLQGYGLAMIARYTPEQLPTVLALAAKTQEGKAAIAGALTTTNAKGWTALHNIAHYAPNDLPKVLDLAAESEAGKYAIAQALKSSAEGITGFRMIIRYAPNGLSKILEIAQQNSPGWAGMIAHLLETENANKWTGVHSIAFYAPDALLPYLEEAAKTEDGLKAIVSTLTATTKDNWTGLHTVAMYAPSALAQFLEFAGKTEEGLIAIAEAITKQNKYGWTVLQMVAYYSPDCLPLLLNLAAQTQRGLTNIAKAISATTTQEFNTDKKSQPDGLKIKAGWSGLQIVACYAPQCLDELIKVATKTDQGWQAIQQTKDMEISDSDTCLDAIMKHAQSTYEKISQPTSTSVSIIAKHLLQFPPAFLTNETELDDSDSPHLHKKR